MELAKGFSLKAAFSDPGVPCPCTPAPGLNGNHAQALVLPVVLGNGIADCEHHGLSHLNLSQEFPSQTRTEPGVSGYFIRPERAVASL